VHAARAALHNPLLSDINLQGCQALLINITAGSDMKMSELDEVSQVVISETGSTANIIMGLIFDEKTTGKISVTVIATGLSHTEEQILAFSNIKPKSIEEASPDIKEILDRLKYTQPNQTEIPNSTTKEEPIPLSTMKTDIPSFLKALD